MKKIIAAIMVMVILTLSLGMAQAEAYENYAKSVLKTGAQSETMELQEEAEKLFGEGLGIKVALIETKCVSAGEAKYRASESEKLSWFQKAWDWATFWN